MRAILLAGGLGTRLRPLTESVPKCLVQIKGVPLLGIWLRQLTNAGVGPFLINTHHLAKQVETFISASEYANAVTLVDEKELLGTAGTLLANVGFFNGSDGLLIHADNYCMQDIHSFVEAHHNRPKECLMTMMTFRTQNPSACGVVELNERGVVVGFHEKVKNPPTNLANGAIYALSERFLKIVVEKFHDATDFSTQILPQFVGAIYTYEATEVFIDIGTPEAYARANQLS